MRKKGKAVTTLIVSGLAVILCCGLLLMVIRQTNCGTDKFKTFYVTDESGRVFTTTDTASIPKTVDTTFKVHYVFTGNKGYSVKILPNITEETAFTYTVDGEFAELTEETDLSEAFGIREYESYFTLTMPETMTDVLTAYHEGQSVEVPEEVDITEKFYFKLEVTSADGKSETVIMLKREVVTTTDDVKFEEKTVNFYG